MFPCNIFISVTYCPLLSSLFPNFLLLITPFSSHLVSAGKYLYSTGLLLNTLIKNAYHLCDTI